MAQGSHTMSRRAGTYRSSRSQELLRQWPTSAGVFPEFHQWAKPRTLTSGKECHDCLPSAHTRKLLQVGGRRQLASSLSGSFYPASSGQTPACPPGFWGGASLLSQPAHRVQACEPHAPHNWGELQPGAGHRDVPGSPRVESLSLECQGNDGTFF